MDDDADTLADDDSILFRADMVRRRGGDSELQRAVRRGELVRLRPGVYVPRVRWDAAASDRRVRWRAQALATTARRPVFCLTTAAVLHGLTLWRLPDTVVHTLDDSPRPARTRASVLRHEGALPHSDVDERDGMLVTSLARTVFDVARIESAERALVVADSAFRTVAWEGRGRYRRDRADAFRADLRRRVAHATGVRGIRGARRLIELADGRAQLPGESISRLWMLDAGAPLPELQRKVHTRQGLFFPDFAWPELRLFGEFDGDGKYLDPQLTGGRGVRSVLRAQRARESAISAATGWRSLRWGWEALRTRTTFAALLREHHLIR